MTFIALAGNQQNAARALQQLGEMMAGFLAIGIDDDEIRLAALAGEIGEGRRSAPHPPRGSAREAIELQLVAERRFGGAYRDYKARVRRWL